MFTVTLFFPRFTLKKYVLTSLVKGKFFREGSPPCGFSTFMTSAPKSARSMVQNGPARAQVISNTLTPFKGPGIKLLSIADFEYYPIRLRIANKLPRRK
jgi:hypothetical protein